MKSKEESHKPRPLTEEELKAVAGVGGQGLRGRGKLHGEIAVSADGKVELITFAKGTRSAVIFDTDVPTARGRGLVGQTIWLSGLICKNSPYHGTLTGARWIRRPSETPLPGAHVVLHGRIDNREPVVIGGEAPPSGSYLVPAQGLVVEGQRFDAVFLEREFPAGQTIEVHGRLDVRAYGGVETEQRRYLALNGVSDLSAGEPRFDGLHFLDKSGDALRTLVLERREIFDAPNLILVLDEEARSAFVGTMGGFRIPSTNPFHGFQGQTKIVAPTDADRAALRFTDHGPFNVATGAPLEVVGRHKSPPGHASDQLVSVYYYGDDADVVYVVVSGGIAGFVNRLEAVVHLPR